MPTPKPKPVDIITPEPEPNNKYDQVQEPTTLSIPVGVLVESKGMEESHVYTPASEGELYLASLNDYEVEEVIHYMVFCLHWSRPSPSLLHLRWSCPAPSLLCLR